MRIASCDTHRWRWRSCARARRGASAKRTTADELRRGMPTDAVGEAAGRVLRRIEARLDERHAAHGAARAAGLTAPLTAPVQLGVQIEGQRTGRSAPTPTRCGRSSSARRRRADPRGRRERRRRGRRARRVSARRSATPASRASSLHRMMEAGPAESPAADVATFEDHLRLVWGRKQLYGTQFRVDDAAQSCSRRWKTRRTPTCGARMRGCRRSRWDSVWQRTRNRDRSALLFHQRPACCPRSP